MTQPARTRQPSVSAFGHQLPSTNGRYAASKIRIERQLLGGVRQLGHLSGRLHGRQSIPRTGASNTGFSPVNASAVGAPLQLAQPLWVAALFIAAQPMFRTALSHCPSRSTKAPSPLAMTYCKKEGHCTRLPNPRRMPQHVRDMADRVGRTGPSLFLLRRGPLLRIHGHRRMTQDGRLGLRPILVP